MTEPTPSPAQRAALEEFLHCLVTAALNAELHTPGHQHVEDGLREAVRSLGRAAAQGLPLPLRFEIRDDCLHHQGAALEGPSLQARPLLRRCCELGIGALAFGAALQADELGRFLELLLGLRGRDALQRGHRARALAAHGIRNVLAAGPAGGHAGEEDSGHEALHSYQDLAEVLQDNHVRAHHDQALAIDQAQGVVEQAIQQMESEPSRLLAMAHQDHIDRFTVGHSVRVALLALQVARAAGADRGQMIRIGTAALLHDIGKSKVPQEILFKRGRLDDEEWRWMSQHPRLGAQILLEQPDLEPSAIGAAFCHHMRPGDAGYPRPTLPFQPSSVSRLVRVCDVFEALTSLRPYKRALTPCEAYAVMFRSESDFDPGWLRFFAQVLGVYPQGTRVLLTDGSVGLVVRQGRRPLLPVVRLVAGPDGLPPLEGTPLEVATGTAVDGVLRHVAVVLMHDRAVTVPEPDLEDPRILTEAPEHHCLGALTRQP